MHCMHACIYNYVYIYIYVNVCVRPCVFTAHFWYQQPNSWITWWFGPRGVELQAYEIVQKTFGACWIGASFWGSWHQPSMSHGTPWFAMTLDLIRAGLLLILKEAGWLSDCIGSVCHFYLVVEPWWSHFWPHRNPTFQTDFGPWSKKMSNLNKSTISL